MKAIILAAGMGARLRPLTNSVPKCLIEIKDGISLLDYQISVLRNAGFSEEQIFLVIGYQAKKIKEKYNNLNYILNEKYTSNNIYSFFLIGKAIKDDFILINSDTLFPESLLVQLTKVPDYSAMVIDKKDKIRNEEMKTIVEKDGFLKRLSKELLPSMSSGEYIGLSFFKWKDAEKIFKKMRDLLEEGKFDLWYEDAIDKLLIQNQLKIYAYFIENVPWIEVDTIDDLQVAREKIKEIENYDI